MKVVNYFDEKIDLEEIYKEIESESKKIGFYHLCEQETEHFIDFAKNVKQKNVVVLGIGGSSLGTVAVYTFVSHQKKLDKNLFIVDTTDPLTIEKILKQVDIDDAFFCVVSKSGTTIETIAVLKLFAFLVEFSKSNCLVITGKGTKLDTFAKKRSIPVFYIPENVGGRFSVLSSVGLVPLSILGIDVDSLLQGAKKIKDSFFSMDFYFDAITKKAIKYAENSWTIDTNVIFCYSDAFKDFNRWYVQLWAESLGKRKIHSKTCVGLTPVGLIGPVDQHSFLQLIEDGKKDKTLTIIKVNEFRSDIFVPNISLEHLEELDILNNIGFAKLINMQADALIDSFKEQSILLDVIELERIDEKSFGSLIMYYEILTAVMGKLLDINTYDQPGVEKTKRILKTKLLREGKT